MKLYEFPKKNYQAKSVAELLNMAEYSDGVVMFRDDLGQIWKLEKVIDVTLEVE